MREVRWTEVRKRKRGREENKANTGCLCLLKNWSMREGGPHAETSTNGEASPLLLPPLSLSLGHRRRGNVEKREDKGEPAEFEYMLRYSRVWEAVIATAMAVMVECRGAAFSLR